MEKDVFLIVENDPNDAFLIGRALQTTARCGRYFVCRNVSEAKAFLQGAGMYSDRTKYPMQSVVLSDLGLGEDSDIEFVEWIRKQKSPIKDVCVIILTGSATPLQFDAAERIGAQKVFRKPTRLEDLQKLLIKIADEFCSGA